MFDNIMKLKEKALDTDILSNDQVILSIEKLTELGDFSILPRLLEQEAALVWEGPIGDGMEGIAHQFNRYRNAVKKMAEAEAGGI